MAFVGKAAKYALGGLLGGDLVGKLFGGKKKETVKALPQVSRDDAAAEMERDDELRRRKGGAADILNGQTGTEAALSGGKLVLGS